MLRPLVFVAALAGLLDPSAFIAHQKPATVPSAEVSLNAQKPDYSKEGVIYEKVATDYDFNADGTGSKTLEVRARVQSAATVQQLGLLSFAYASGNERVEIDYLRVRKPDGTVIDTPASDAQDMPTDVTRAAPFYSDLKELQIPVKSLSAGDELEYRVRFDLDKPLADGQFWGSSDWIVANVVLDESVELSFPAGKYVQVLSPSSNPQITEQHGRKIYTWKSLQLKTTSDKPETPDPDAMSPINWTTFHDWKEIGNWYGSLATDRAAVTPEIQAKVRELIQGKTTDDEKMEAIYSYVSLQVRYIGVAFGIGRYQPHSATTVFDNQYGDCKDKDTLLRTMLKAAGFDAWPALIGSSHPLHPELPSPAQFDHVITVVPRGNDIIWLDSTPEVSPWKMLLFPLRDKQALAIPTTGDPKLMRTPADGPFPFTTAFVATAKLDEAGTLTGHLSFTLRGDSEVAFRSAYRATSRAQWLQLAQGISERLGYAGTVSNVDVSRPDQTDEPFRVAYDYDRKEFGDWSHLRILPLMTIMDLPEAGDPGKPIQLPAQQVDTLHSEIELPSLYKAELPPSVDYTSPWATYKTTYQIDGNRFITTRTVQILASKVPADSWGKYKDFMDEVSADAGQFVQLINTSYKQTPIVDETPPTPDPAAEDASARAVIQAAQEEITAGDYPAARRLLRQVEVANPHQDDLWSAYVQLDLAEHQPDQELADLRREIAANPRNRGTYHFLYQLEMWQKKTTEAIATLDDLLKVAPDDTNSALLASTLLIDHSRYNEAVTLLGDEIRQNPKNRNLAVQQARAQILTGDRAAGVAALRNSIDDADNPEILSAAAERLADQDIELPLAESLSRKAVDVAEKRTQAIDLATISTSKMDDIQQLPTPWEAMGWVYYREQKLDIAEQYERAAWLAAQSNRAGDFLGQIYEKEGRSQDAVNTYALANPPAQPPWANVDPEAKAHSLARLKELMAKGIRPKHSDVESTSVDFPMAGTQYYSAEFYVLLGQGRVQDVLFIHGDNELKSAADVLRKADFSGQIPADSRARLVRRGTMSCLQGTTKCQFTMSPLASSSLVSRSITDSR